MDTFEARSRLRDMANQGLEIVDRLHSAEFTRAEAGRQYRSLLNEARSLLADAGYPGEAAWRALQHSVALLDSWSTEDDVAPEELAEELREARDGLDALLSPRQERDLDFRIVG